MPAITSYFAELGFGVNAKSIRKVDSALKNMEKKLKAFGKTASQNMAINLVKFNVNQKALNFAMGSALDLASKQTTFQVSRFVVDQAHLNRTLSNAFAAASKSAKVNIRPNVAPGNAGSARIPGSGRHIVAGGVAGGIAGGLSRLYGPALALGLGGYGLGALNNRNQQVVAAQLQTSAVAQQAGATPYEGKQSFEWLKKQADVIGFNYLDAAPDYNKLTSGLTGAGMSIQQSQGVFKGFSELSRVNKLDRTAQSRVYRALSQIAGKNKLQSEELTGQLAESLPGAVSLFARAYQAQLASEGKGGGKTGQAAIDELNKAMKKGLVKGNILTYAGRLASEQAAPGLEAAKTASQAQQARYQNTVNNLATVASDSGIESGFARLFRALNDGLKESAPMVEGLARGFDNVSKYVSFALLSAQSFQRMLDGRDSFLGNKFFPTPEERGEVLQFLNAYKGAMSEIGQLGKNIYNGWADLLKLFNSDAFVNLKNWANTVSNTVGTINKLAGGDTSGAGEAAKAAGFGYLNYITTPAQKTLDAFGLPASSTMQKLRPDFDPANYETQQRARQDEALANRRRDNFNGTLGIFPMEKAGMPDSGSSSTPSPLAPKADVTLKMDVKITAANPEDFKTQFESSLADIVHQTLDKYSEKE
jgi:hypothetical protein